MLTNKITLALWGLFSLILFTSGIIRHDKDEQEYLRLANEPQFDNVGQVFLDTLPGGSCVLIKKNYVLTAAHVLLTSDFRQDTIQMQGQTIVTIEPMNERVADPAHIFISIGGIKKSVKRIVLHPNYLDTVHAGSCDIAILELNAPFEGIEPTTLNLQMDELFSDVTGVGFGASGVADKPESVGSFHKKIAGQNVVDSLGGFILGGLPTLLVCDFDHPTDASCNKTGSSTARALEYICAGGDSGGGLFRQHSMKWELVGICSGSATDIQQLMTKGYYGQVMRWTRVSAFGDWIKRNTN